jgi:hypothetical protein
VSRCETMKLNRRVTRFKARGPRDEVGSDVGCTTLTGSVRDRFRDESAMSTWSYRVALNTAINWRGSYSLWKELMTDGRLMVG